LRIAVVSDVHGSSHALEAVVDDLRRQSVDVVLHGGDLVVNGPSPDDVATTIRELGWRGVLGNTDEMLWTLNELTGRLARMPRLEPLLRVLHEHMAPAALERLSDVNLRWLRALPGQIVEEGVTLLHASPGDLWRAPREDADDETLQTTSGAMPADVVVYGHIHRPFVRQLPSVVVANSGSVGLTWDGDPRASYLVVDGRTVEVRRVEYAVERDVSDLLSSGLPYARWLAEMRRRAAYLPPDPSLR
jgi:predicted phosphodiesterase